MGRVSVCMATYNGEKYIQEQLGSILSLLAADDEVIISDDNSSDNTLSFIREFKDERIKVYHVTFKNPAKNFEYAIGKAEGDIIILSDQDDVWLPTRLSSIREIFDKTDVQLVISNALIVDQDLQSKGSTLFEYYNTNGSVIRNIIRNTWSGCCMAFRSSARSLILPFPGKIPAHDQWIGTVMGAFHPIKIQMEPQLFHRRHGNNASFTGEGSKFSLWEKLNMRLNLVWLLTARILKIRFKR